MNNSFLILLIATAFSGCSLFDSESLTTESGIANEGLELYFQELYNLAEYGGYYEGVDPELYLVMSTKEKMPCMNYKIDYKADFNPSNSKTREINLVGRSLPGFVCLTAIGPAVSQISYEKAPPKTELVIKDGDYADRFKVEITDEYVQIKTVQAIFTELIDNRFYLKPENSFYFKCGTLNSMTDLCSDFDSLLKQELSITEFHFPDDGVIPYPEFSQGNQYNHPSIFYTYQSEEEFEKAGLLLEQFTEERIGTSEGNSLSIVNWRNQGYRSWVFQNN